MAKKFWFFALSFLLIPTVLFAFQPLFDTWIGYDVGLRPEWITTADMDGDFDYDLVVANYLSNSVSIFKNNGDGSFGNRVDIPCRERPSFVTVADLDVDGDLDLITSNNGNCCHGIAPQYITIFKNNGDGSFGGRVDYPSGYAPKSIVATDLDGDGDLDLAVANTGWSTVPSTYADSTISILKNNGDGTFVAKVDYVVGYYPYSTLGVDFDGDGDVDLAVVNSDSNLSIFWNDGNGTFTRKSDYSAGSMPRRLSAADFDNDGNVDLAVGHNGSKVSVLMNAGNGNFNTLIDYDANGSAFSIYASDVNGDGYQDLVTNNISVLKNKGDGTFQAGVTYRTGDGAESISASDLDGDGDEDLVTANWWSETISVHRNKGDGTFHPKLETYQAGVYPSSVYASDLDGDGDDDLAVANAGVCGDFFGCQDYSVSVLKNDGAGKFLEVGRYPTYYNSVSVFVSDLDEDGDNDLAVANAGSLHGFANSVSVIKNNGNGTFIGALGYNAGNGPVSVFASDLDGDGDQDLAVANAGVSRFYLGNTVSILKNRGDGTFANGVDYAAGNGPSSVFASDLDGDGDIDLAVANTGTYWLYGEAPDSTVSVFLNNGDGTFAAKVDYATRAAPRSVFLSDLDGDRDQDVATSSGTVLINDGNGGFTSRTDYAFWGSSIFVADLDGDGYKDLVTPSSSKGVVSVLKNNGIGSFIEKIDYGVGGYPNSVFASDLDRDGDQDLAVVDDYNGVTILRNLSNTRNCAAKGDLNGDENLTIFDVVLLLNCVFLGEGNCGTCFADVNCNGFLTAADIVLELYAVFSNRPFLCS